VSSVHQYRLCTRDSGILLGDVMKVLETTIGSLALKFTQDGLLLSSAEFECLLRPMEAVKLYEWLEEYRDELIKHTFHFSEKPNQVSCQL
jgi:hypothetical protein